MNGSKVPLPVTDPKDETGAYRALAVLLEQIQNGGGPVRTEPLDKLRDEWLTLKTANTNAHTRKAYAIYLNALCARFSKKKLNKGDALTPENVVAAAEALEWSASTRANFLSVARAFLIWTGRTEFKKVKVPPKDSRGPEAVISPEAQAIILQETRGDFNLMCRFMYAVGCRPMEAARLTVEMCHLNTDTATLKEHKSKDKIGVRRVLYFNAEAVAIVKAQHLKYKTGPLFRNTKGKPFSRMAIVKRFWRMRDKLPQHVTAYFYRHTFITRCLEKGVPDTHVAAIVGHVNTQMIHKHYSHIANNSRLLLDDLRKLDN